MWKTLCVCCWWIKKIVCINKVISALDQSNGKCNAKCTVFFCVVVDIFSCVFLLLYGSHQVFIGSFYMITSNGDDDNARVIAYVCNDSFTTQWKFHLRITEMHFILFKATINAIFYCIHLGKLQINWIDSSRHFSPVSSPCFLSFGRLEFDAHPKNMH